MNHTRYGSIYSQWLHDIADFTMGCVCACETRLQLFVPDTAATILFLPDLAELLVSAYVSVLHLHTHTHTHT